MDSRWMETAASPTRMPTSRGILSSRPLNEPTLAKPMKRILKRILLAIPIAFTLISLVYLIYYDGYRDVIQGRVHREAYDLFGDVEDVHEARIYLIMGEGKSDGTFPIRPYDRDDPTYGSVVLKGTQLAEFLKLWQYQEVDARAGSWCHGPVYGFRLYRRGKPVRETSICWSCNNFWVDPYPGGATWYGFHADSKAGKRLLEFCDKLLPYQKTQ